MKHIFTFLLLLPLLALHGQDCTALQFTATASESRCMATGSIAIAASGGSGNYNFRVTGPVNPPITSSPTITGLRPGYYQVWVKDMNTGCIRQQDSLFVPGTYSDPRFQLTKTDVTCNGNDGTISLVGQEHGRSPFSYTIVAPSPSAVGTTNATGNFTGLTAGEYFVRLEDSCGGIQVRRVTIENYSWWFDAATITRVSCDSGEVFVRIRDNRGNLNTSSTAFNGFTYGVVPAPGDTAWFATNTFRFRLGSLRTVDIVAKDPCGNVHPTTWSVPPAQQPSTGAVNLGSFNCTAFTATVTGQQNLTNPTYELVDANNVSVATNTTGSFPGLNYGSYCVRITDACYDTTITRCFTGNRPVPAIGATVGISNQNCNTFTATITGQRNLTSPQFCLYDADGAQLACNTTGVFDGLTYGDYCIRMNDGCTDTTITRCFTAARPLPVLTSAVVSGTSCTSFNLTASGNNLNNPQYCLYDSNGNVVSCNTTGVFTGIANGSYCVRAITSCGDSTAPVCVTVAPPRPSIGSSVSISNRTCSGFNAAITGQANLTNPQYCLYDANDVQIACNTTGSFTNLPYGAYCIRMTDGCVDTTITRCFTQTQARPSISATMQRTASGCSTFSARVTGSNLSSPTYQLFDANDVLVATNTTGQFTDLPYGRYCAVVRDGCVDTTMRVCQTFEPLRQMTLTTSKPCAIGSANVDVAFQSANAPFEVFVYHPDGSLSHQQNSNSASFRMVLPALSSGQQYRVIGQDACGQRDTAFITPDATLVSKSITATAKCPSATWQNGSGDLVVNCSSNIYSVIPRIIRKDGATFSRSHSAQSGTRYNFNDLEPATYVMEYTLQTCNSKLYDTVAIAPYAYPTQGQSAIYQCDNSGFSLTADVAGGISPYSYQIIGSQPESPSIASEAQASPLFSINTGTTYSLVRLRTLDACGNATLNDISVLPLQNIVISADSTCFFTNITLTVDTIPNANYEWFRKTSEVDSVRVGSGPQYNLPFFRPEEQGLYICKVTLNGSCIMRQASYNLDGECGQIHLPAGTVLKAKRSARGVELHWDTRNEQGIEHYVLERKRSGETAYQALTRTTARTGARHYQYLDSEPGTGTADYRLRILRTGGKATYSNSVRLSGGTLRLSVYPNPAGAAVQVAISGEATASYRLQLVHAGGAVVFQKEVPNVRATTLTIPRSGGLHPGIYLLRLTHRATGEVWTEKVYFK